MKKHVLFLLLLGALSGLISSLVLAYTGKTGGSISDFIQNFFPGIIFGLILGVYFYIKSMCKFYKSLIFIFVSASAYWLAVQLALFAPFSLATGHSGVPGVFDFMLAGALGSAILALAIRLLVEKIKILPALLIVIIGTITAYLFITLYSIDASGTSPYIIWQAAVASAIGFTLGHLSKEGPIEEITGVEIKNKK